mgnify:CR=1 FL=1
MMVIVLGSDWGAFGFGLMGFGHGWNRRGRVPTIELKCESPRLKRQATVDVKKKTVNFL